MRIAIIKLSAMGDIIHAMVALQFIKNKNPNIVIDWFVEESFVEILEGNLHIDNIFTLNIKGIKQKKTSLFKQIKLVRSYAKNNYDFVIDTQGLIKSAIVGKLLKGEKFVGFSKNSIRESLATIFYNQKIKIAYHKNTIDRNIKVLCEPLKIAVTSEEIIQKERFLSYIATDENKKNFKKNKKNIIFIIGSTWKSRNYPKEKFVEIADKLKQNCLIVWGNEIERLTAKWIDDHSNYATIVPRNTLNTLKALIGQADLLIGNDTGPAHIAWGLNIPSIIIFGPTPVNRVYQTAINKTVKSSSLVNHYKLNKNDFSITEIKSEEIIELAQNLLN